ncbi:MAG: hypothetical protein WKG03_01100 [Telluria sp.]
MKRLFVLMSCAVSLSAVASGEPVKPKVVVVPSSAVVQTPARADVYRVTPARTTPVDMNRATVIQVPAGANVSVVSSPSVMVQGERPSAERTPFRAGVSTVTVEKMAQAQGCVGGQGAGLMTPQGPVEIYRMVCETGQVFMAKCELRQCRTVSAVPPGGYGAWTETAASTTRQALRRSEVPALVLDWRCGNCIPNAAFAAALRQAYAAEAGRNGMAVSGVASATVSVLQFSKQIFPLKNTLAMSAVFGRQAVSVQESTTAFSGMDLLAANSGRKLFQEMRGKTF